MHHSSPDPSRRALLGLAAAGAGGVTAGAVGAYLIAGDKGSGDAVTEAELKAHAATPHGGTGAGLNGYVDITTAPYSCDPTGATDCSKGLQAAIDACIGPGDPSTVRRKALKALYVPPGAYKLSDTVRIKSVLGFTMLGCGPQVSVFFPGAKLDTMLEINGVSFGVFKDFEFVANGADFAVDKVVWYHWNKTSSLGSSSGCSFYNVLIREISFRVAWSIGGEEADGGLQVDGSNWYGCIATGQYPVGSGDTKTWQYGYKLGSGVSGNNVDHSFFGSSAAHCKFGFYFAGSNAGVWGGQPADNEVDFHIVSPTTYFVFQGIRSEGAQRFLTTGSAGSSCNQITLRDICFVGNNIHPDGMWIDTAQAGGVNLDNIQCTNAVHAAKIRVNAQVDFNQGCQVVVNNVRQSTPIAAGLVGGSGTKFVVVSYTETSSDNRAVASSQLITVP